MDKLFLETSKGFRDEFSFLSNMYPVDIYYHGYWFPSSENVYQWLKCAYVQPFSNMILETKDGKSAKRIARKQGFPECSIDYKIKCMRIALDLKFEIPKMKDMLLSTGEIELVEYNWWKDRVWGVYKGEGKNLLGNMLMNKRRELLS